MNSTGHYIGPDSAPDRYRLLNSIGRGGEAVLYRAEIQLDGAPETVVVKVLDSGTTLTPDQFERLSAKWNEQAELLRFVGRPGVVGVREHFEGPPIHGLGQSSTAAGRALVLVMNHVDGLDLRDWRAERTLATHQERREVSRALEQLADVLDWLHSGSATTSGRPVIHGDLSPGNVMVDAHGQATLVDFGLSKLTADHETAQVWFTPGYAAPEVFQGKRTPNTDRYAFGAIAYFLLSGQAPPSTPEQLRLAYGQLPQVAALAPDRREQVLAICATDPAGRPESLRAWVKDIRDVVVSTTAAPGTASARDAVPPPPATLPPPTTVTGAGPEPVTQGPPTTVTGAGTGAGVEAPSTAGAGVPEPDTTGPFRLAPPPAPTSPAPRKPRSTLVRVLAVALAASLGAIGVLTLALANDDDKKGGKAAPGPTVTVTEKAKDDGGDSGQDDGGSAPSPGDSTGASAEPGDVAAADEQSLTQLSPVDGDDRLTVKSAAIDSIDYDNALVSAPDECSGYAEYNLDRSWSKLDLVAGIEDNSKDYSARLDIKIDGKSLFGGKVDLLAGPKKLSLNVKNGLRLSISYADLNGNCDVGVVALGKPTLKK
ncbi:protein kinase domain-containing protein [Streptomyces sp. G45]|uniref:protein kinase domain-containing protein n=1 Tax=Streptomyces sp. G45 TaxID=3406627 RepID=UPI003C28D95C